MEEAREADRIVKASDVGVFDQLLDCAVLENDGGRARVACDVDAPATLDRVRNNPGDPFAPLIPRYDFIFAYGGEAAVVRAYQALGPQHCIPIYNALDPTTHFPAPDVGFEAEPAFLGNPDREASVDDFFRPGNRSRGRFLLGGAAWQDRPLPQSVRYAGQVYTEDHNASTRAAACPITDHWEGMEAFLEPDPEILVARDGALVMGDLRATGAAPITLVRAEHTHGHRAQQAHEALPGDRNI